MNSVAQALILLIGMPSIRDIEHSFANDRFKGESAVSQTQRLSHALQKLNSLSSQDLRRAFVIVDEVASAPRNTAAKRLAEAAGDAQLTGLNQSSMEKIIGDLKDRAALANRYIFACGAPEPWNTNSSYFHRWSSIATQQLGHIDRQFPLIVKGSDVSLDSRMYKFAGSGGGYSVIREFDYYSTWFPRRR